MGRKTAEVRINGHLSNHNSEQDELDRATWDRFLAEVRELASKPEYAELEIDVSDMGVMVSNAVLGPNDEPQNSGAVVAVHWGDYRRQECWVRSGAMVGNWFPLGGEFGRPKVAEDPRSEMDKMTSREYWQRPAGTIPLHPDWYDVLKRGPVTLLVPGDADTYRQGWRAGRRDLWQTMEDVAYEDPREPERETMTP